MHGDLTDVLSAAQGKRSFALQTQPVTGDLHVLHLEEAGVPLTLRLDVTRAKIMTEVTQTQEKDITCILIYSHSCMHAH